MPSLRDAKYDFHAIIRKWLPKMGKPKRVIVVGAGMAGLVAAYEAYSAA